MDVGSGKYTIPLVWFYAIFFARRIKVNRPIHHSVVGQSNRCHSVSFCHLHHVINFGHAVKKRVVGVGMEVDEFH